jgi:hypothetical protein
VQHASFYFNLKNPFLSSQGGVGDLSAVGIAILLSPFTVIVRSFIHLPLTFAVITVVCNSDTQVRPLDIYCVIYEIWKSAFELSFHRFFPVNFYPSYSYSFTQNAKLLTTNQYKRYYAA